MKNEKKIWLRKGMEILDVKLLPKEIEISMEVFKKRSESSKERIGNVKE